MMPAHAQSSAPTCSLPDGAPLAPSNYTRLSGFRQPVCLAQGLGKVVDELVTPRRLVADAAIRLHVQEGHPHRLGGRGLGVLGRRELAEALPVVHADLPARRTEPVCDRAGVLARRATL